MKIIDKNQFCTEIVFFFLYLKIKNTLPNENKSANFLAFKINTGKYNVDNDIQNIPIPKHIKNPNIRCKRD